MYILKHNMNVSFQHYIDQVKDNNIHSSKEKILIKYADYFSFNKEMTKHMIFYGPSGIGKYSQCLYFLSLIHKKPIHDKKFLFTYKTKSFTIRNSDIHCEIDIQLLGCNAKALWHSLYNQIVDIIYSNLNEIRFIVCKNMHNIHPELLEVFYHYMKNKIHKPISYIFITETISCFPDHILQICEHIHFKRPMKSKYKAITQMDTIDFPLSEINTMQRVFHKTYIHTKTHKKLCDSILEYIRNPTTIFELRNMIYDLLTYHLNIDECLIYIIQELHLSTEQMKHIINQLYIFYEIYYNNYRNIFHLESIILHITRINNHHDEISTCT